MKRLEKCELAVKRGNTYNPETGEIFGVKGEVIIGKTDSGYIRFSIGLKNKYYVIRGHHFAWYWVYGNVDFEMLDHINRDKSDNRICNLQSVNHQQNSFNTNAKGYSWNIRKNKWETYIAINKKKIHLGYFDLEEDARNSYLQAKKKYHI